MDSGTKLASAERAPGRSGQALAPAPALAAAGLDPGEVSARLRQSHGHVCAYVTMDKQGTVLPPTSSTTL